eukprot:5475282-Pleurochrysis_carterae.AAC.1
MDAGLRISEEKETWEREGGRAMARAREFWHCIRLKLHEQLRYLQEAYGRSCSSKARLRCPFEGEMSREEQTSHITEKDLTKIFGPSLWPEGGSRDKEGGQISDTKGTPSTQQPTIERARCFRNAAKRRTLEKNGRGAGRRVVGVLQQLAREPVRKDGSGCC